MKQGYIIIAVLLLATTNSVFAVETSNVIAVQQARAAKPGSNVLNMTTAQKQRFAELKARRYEANKQKKAQLQQRK